MSRNLYKETFDNIKISEEVLAKAIETSKNFNKDDYKTKNKVIKFKPIAMIAASLAVVITLTAVIAGLPAGNSFMLTGYASEITNDSYVTIGEISEQSGSELVYNPNGVVAISAVFDFFVRCEGNNVKSITYTANNCKFMVNESYDGILKYSIRSNSYGETEFFGKTSCSSYTIAYDKQPVAETYECTCTSHVELTQEDITEEFINSQPPVELAFDVTFPDVLPDYENFDYMQYYYDNIGKVYEAIINGPKEYTIDITVNYTDGESDTSTLVLSCEENKDSDVGYNITARLK